jgi:hypothetical protein
VQEQIKKMSQSLKIHWDSFRSSVVFSFVRGQTIVSFSVSFVNFLAKQQVIDSIIDKQQLGCDQSNLWSPGRRHPW